MKKKDCELQGANEVSVKDLKKKFETKLSAPMLNSRLSRRLTAKQSKLRIKQSF